MKGRYCEQQLAPKRKFDRRSFRWKRSNSHWVLIGCPKGKWNAKRKRCKVGTRAHKLLEKAKRGKRCCPRPRPRSRCIIK